MTKHSLTLAVAAALIALAGVPAQAGLRIEAKPSHSAIDPNARAVIGRPITTTTCDECRRAAESSSLSMDVCTCIAMLAMACSTASCCFPWFCRPP